MIWRVILFWLLGANLAWADLPQAVKTANGLNYAYDLCGNMLARGRQQLVYNAENRLFAVVSSNQVATFGYDADGTRLWKQGVTNTLQVWIGGNYEEKDGKILYHISAGDRLVCTFDASNSVFEYYHPDHIHSAEILSDSSGNLYQHYEYSAYGQSRYTLSSTAFPISRRYTSQVLDEETGLYYFGARYYDPQLGRFIQPDTSIPNAFNPQAYDRYAYCYDNPLKYLDPNGHAGYWADVGQVWLGYYDAGSGLVQGSAFAMTHPVTTVEGIGTAVVHPINTAETIANGVAQDWNSGLRGQGQVVGSALIVAGTVAAPAAEAGNVSSAGQVAGAASKVEEGGTAVQTTESAATATGADTGTAGANGASANSGSSTSASGGGMAPSPNAQGAHTVFKVDPQTGKVVKYQTFEPQTNPKNPNPWNSTKRFDASGKSHFNKETQQPVPTPHVHDPETPGGVRPPDPAEIPQ